MRNSANGVNFFIHDLNPYGGQDRSTLEILNFLSEEIPVHVYAYSFENPGKPDSKIIFHRCPFPIRRPVLLKSILFQIWTLWVRLIARGRINVSTGTCSLASDLVHVQFVAKAWKKEKEKTLVRKKGWHRAYHRVLAYYNEKMEDILFSRNLSFAAISRSVATDLKEHFPIEKVEIVYHGVDSAKFTPVRGHEERLALRQKLGLPAGKIFLLVGAFERKGLATLALAGKKVRAEFPEAKIIAVGSGANEEYHRLVEDPSSPDWLRLIPPSRNIEEYYQAADAFVLPTLYEPFGLVILEAMGAGLPVITSACAGAAELIRHGENGLLLKEPTDVNELAGRMKELLRDPGLSRKLSSNARLTAESRQWHTVAREFRALLETAGRP